MRVLSIALFACLFCVSFADRLFSEPQYKNAFVNWMQEHQRSYGVEDFKSKYETFKNNMDFVESWNSRKESYTVSLNKFADLSNEEWNKLYKGMKVDATKLNLKKQVTHVDVEDVPSSKDWRQDNIVTPIKDQGQCGSCWSFSTTGSVEGAHAQHDKLVSLSEQNLVDCSGSYGNMGCNGGLMTSAMQYIIDNKGIDTEDSYPYTAADGTCSFDAKNVGSTLSGMVNVSTGNETDLMVKVAAGPVSIAIDASATSFQLYTSGVYWSYTCSSTQLDHGVLAVGYGSESGTDYWIVKNSWGTGWGDKGYIKMIRNWENDCGVSTMATLPIY